MAIGELGMTENILAQWAGDIVSLHQVERLEQRDDSGDKVHKCFRRHRIDQVKAVEAGLEPIL